VALLDPRREAPLVILLEVDTKRIAGLEFECDAPWSVDVNGITLWFAAQWMES
jgi:hypothetical protein